jgi:hypothetical protein
MSRRVKMCSNVPAYSSLLVRKPDLRLKIFLKVAWMEECLYSDVHIGLFNGQPTTVSTLIHNEIINVGILTPSQSNWKKGTAPVRPAGIIDAHNMGQDTLIALEAAAREELECWMESFSMATSWLYTTSSCNALKIW